MKRKIVFDLDDTLIPNTWKYHGPTWECGRIIADALGWKSPLPVDVLKLQMEIDLELTKQMGFVTYRFPLSWVRTYEELCRRAEVASRMTVIMTLKEVASDFAEPPFAVFEGATDALSRLKRSGHELHLVTAGDEDLQRRKIKETDLARWFDSVHVTPMKKGEILAKIAGRRPKNCVMVGDSKKSDIMPALELGITAVWIPSQTWSFADADVDASKYHKVKSISEVPALIEKLP
jgi:putative hydrolase of the HAD superfamily